MTEADLVIAARGGDRAAMAALVASHAAAAQRLALHLTRSLTDAEDAVQTAFVKAFTHLDQFDVTRPFEPWLLRIVANEVRRTRRDEGFRWQFWRSHRPAESTAEAAERTVMVRLEHSALYDAVRSLRHEDRVLISLAYFMGQSEAQIAAALGIPRGTVKSRKHHALRRLRQALSDEPEARGALGDEAQPEVEAR